LAVDLPQLGFVATGNAGKLREILPMIREHLGEYLSEPLQVEGRAAQNAEETAPDFIGNARIKAQALAQELIAEGRNAFWVLADDSGLEVDALDGAPGVFSARYAGVGAGSERNLKKLLEELKKRGLPSGQASARYRCALVLLLKDGARSDIIEYLGDGSCEGFIGDQPRGDAGFGYDPIFLTPDLSRSFAELSYEEKNRASHRRRAFEALTKSLAR
jgi:XTP/dITP diphosphohydrolase